MMPATSVKNSLASFGGYSVLTCFGMALNLLFNSILAHTLSKAELGVYSFGFSIVSACYLLLDPGLTAFVSRELAQGRMSQESSLSVFLTYAVRISGLFLAAGLLLCWIGRTSGPKYTELIFGAAFFLVPMQAMNFEWFQLASFQHYRAGATRALGGALACLGAGLLVFTGAGAVGAMVVRTASVWLANLLMNLGLISHPQIRAVSFDKVRPNIGRGLIFLRLQLMQVGLTSVPPILMGIMTSSESVAVYSVGMQLAGIILVPSILAHLALVPLLSAAYQNDYKQFIQKMRLYAIGVITFVISTGLGWFVLKEILVRFLYSAAYLDNMNVLNYAILGAIGQVCQAYGNHGLISVRQEKIAANLYTWCVLSVCLGSLIVARRYGALGSMKLYAFAMCSGAVLTLLAGWRHWKRPEAFIKNDL